MHQPMFDRDLLYPTNNVLEPGSIHVAVLKPDIRGRVPIVITSKTDHNPLDYVETLVDIIQADIFDRTRMNVREQGIFLFRTEDTYTKLVFEDGKQFTKKIDNIDE